MANASPPAELVAWAWGDLAAAGCRRDGCGGGGEDPPANEASWDDLDAVLGGARCHGGRCYCQRFKLHGTLWPGDDLEHAQMLREQTDCGHPRSGTTSGLVAYVDGEPAGWCNVEPRTAYPYFRSVPWRKRDEDRTDSSIWAVPCFITRSGFRRRGVSYALARAAVDFARQRGARALEGYSMIPEPGEGCSLGRAPTSAT